MLFRYRAINLGKGKGPERIGSRPCLVVTRRRFELRTHCLKGKALILRAGGAENLLLL